MKNMLKKEFVLSLHPTAPIFLILSAMLCIPNYPYYVAFFYTGLALFFTCLNGRENGDIMFSLTLPTAKRSIVYSRILFAVILEAAQVIIAIPFALLRQSYPMPGNEVGMDANLSLFGFSIIMLGIFNLIFFTSYYKNVQKVGGAFVKASSAVFIYIAVAETCDHVVPFMRDVLDTPDSMHLLPKLVLLGVGIVIYILLTSAAAAISVRSFEKFDL